MIVNNSIPRRPSGDNPATTLRESFTGRCHVGNCGRSIKGRGLGGILWRDSSLEGQRLTSQLLSIVVAVVVVVVE